ncbi:hypothetical protein N657DRAFT_681083 [Parathielavia appendiculata]|uniref:F-box domain-containing protein n=1 Tax=Parathielavia appendiculata TaxID=2587402 RepID=A0AAN6U090_9PEZI|nr:hypothetical protein N657DRAFT_681083 [Parathielavia appendiculata]
MLTPSLSRDIISNILYSVTNKQQEEPHDDHEQVLIIKSNTSLASLAATSRAWQTVIEPLTFRSITLSQHDLADAARIITPARQPLVRSLTFNIQLDPYDDARRRVAETPAEHRRNSEVFTAAVRGLFGLLRGWEVEQQQQQQQPGRRRRRRPRDEALDLHLHVWSPSDVDRLAPEESERLVRRLRPVSPLRRYERSVIQYLQEKEVVDLTELEDVGELSIQRFGYRGREMPRAVDVDSAALIVARCTKLTKLNLSVMDWPRGVLEERKRRRRALAAMIDRLPMRLRELSLAYSASPPRDHNCDPPNLLDPGETEDALSLSLRRFYRRWSTRVLDVGNTILGQEFFWREGDENGNKDGEEKYEEYNDSDVESWVDEFEFDRWPCASLQDLRVDWPIVTPDGRWLFQRPIGEMARKINREQWEETEDDENNATDSDKEGKNSGADGDAPAATGPTDPDPELDDPAYTKKHRFRISPVRKLINPLYKAIARAIAQMPALSDFECRPPNQWPANGVGFITDFHTGGGSLWFFGNGWYEDNDDDEGEPIDMGEPLVDEEVVQFFTEVLSEKEPKGEVNVTIS